LLTFDENYELTEPRNLKYPKQKKKKMGKINKLHRNQFAPRQWQRENLGNSQRNKGTHRTTKLAL
jgi:hypothetical protein